MRIFYFRCGTKPRRAGAGMGNMREREATTTCGYCVRVWEKKNKEKIFNNKKNSRDRCVRASMRIGRRWCAARREVCACVYYTDAVAIVQRGAGAKKSSGGQPFVTGRQIVIRLQDKPAEIRVSDNEKWNIIIFYSSSGQMTKPVQNKAPRRQSTQETKRKKWKGIIKRKKKKK